MGMMKQVGPVVLLRRSAMYAESSTISSRVGTMMVTPSLWTYGLSDPCGPRRFPVLKSSRYSGANWAIPL